MLHEFNTTAFGQRFASLIPAALNMSLAIETLTSGGEVLRINLTFLLLDSSAVSAAVAAMENTATLSTSSWEVRLESAPQLGLTLLLAPSPPPPAPPSQPPARETSGAAIAMWVLLPATVLALIYLAGRAAQVVSPHARAMHARQDTEREEQAQSVLSLYVKRMLARRQTQRQEQAQRVLSVYAREMLARRHMRQKQGPGLQSSASISPRSSATLESDTPKHRLPSPQRLPPPPSRLSWLFENVGCRGEKSSERGRNRGDRGDDDEPHGVRTSPNHAPSPAHHAPRAAQTPARKPSSADKTHRARHTSPKSTSSPEPMPQGVSLCFSASPTRRASQPPIFACTQHL